MGEFYTYSPDRVIISFNGMPIRGFAPDTFIEVERDEDGFMKLTGSLGDVARSKNLNKGGKVTITLMAVSPTNDDLYGIGLVDEDDGTAYGEIFIKDLSGNMECHADTAWILKWPTVERGKESGTVTWVFDCASIDVRPGGNIL